MPITVDYTPLTATSRLASIAGRGEHRQRQFQNQMAMAELALRHEQMIRQDRRAQQGLQAGFARQMLGQRFTADRDTAARAHDREMQGNVTERMFDLEGSRQEHQAEERKARERADLAYLDKQLEGQERRDQYEDRQALAALDKAWDNGLFGSPDDPRAKDLYDQERYRIQSRISDRRMGELFSQQEGPRLLSSDELREQGLPPDAKYQKVVRNGGKMITPVDPTWQEENAYKEKLERRKLRISAHDAAVGARTDYMGEYTKAYAEAFKQATEKANEAFEEQKARAVATGKEDVVAQWAKKKPKKPSHDEVFKIAVQFMPPPSMLPTQYGGVEMAWRNGRLVELGPNGGIMRPDPRDPYRGVEVME